MGNIITNMMLSESEECIKKRTKTQELIADAINKIIESLKAHVYDKKCECDITKSIRHLQKKATEEKIYNLIYRYDVMEIKTYICTLGSTKYAIMHIISKDDTYELNLWPCPQGGCVLQSLKTVDQFV